VPETEEGVQNQDLVNRGAVSSEPVQTAAPENDTEPVGADVPVRPQPLGAVRKALLGNGASQMDYDNAVSFRDQGAADVSFYTAAVQTAKINLGYTSVIAPITGRLVGEGIAGKPTGVDASAFSPNRFA